MLNLYVVSCAGSFSHHAVYMLSLCDYYNLCGSKALREREKINEDQKIPALKKVTVSELRHQRQPLDGRIDTCHDFFTQTFRTRHSPAAYFFYADKEKKLFASFFQEVNIELIEF